jgi:hypothetical protein
MPGKTELELTWIGKENRPKTHKQWDGLIVDSYGEEKMFLSGFLLSIGQLRQVHIERNDRDADLPAFEDFVGKLDADAGGRAIRQLRWPARLRGEVEREQSRTRDRDNPLPIHRLHEGSRLYQPFCQG